MKTQTAATVEFIARENVDYWEIIALRCSPATAVRRLQSLVETTDTPAFRAHNVTVEIGKCSFVIRFDAPGAEEAENFATLMAQSLGWKKSHGVLLGRAD
jgi:hypothetical protein